MEKFDTKISDKELLGFALNVRNMPEKSFQALDDMFLGGDRKEYYEGLAAGYKNLFELLGIMNGNRVTREYIYQIFLFISHKLHCKDFIEPLGGNVHTIDPYYSDKQIHDLASVPAKEDDDLIEKFNLDQERDFYIGQTAALTTALSVSESGSSEMKLEDDVVEYIKSLRVVIANIVETYGEIKKVFPTRR